MWRQRFTNNLRLATMVLVSTLLFGCVWVPLQPPSFATGPVHVSAVHEVREGETLEDIAVHFDTTPAAIAAANNLQRLDTPPVGTELRIPRQTFSRPALRQVLQRPSLRFLKLSHLLSGPQQDEQ
ncbi:MAG: LysM peptidoglycan-binding domain-containing protein [Candidatus Sumerlaeaceae bacterium]|nr:LysM peptidoglycan-binding domain-containing protein [Candidatus Sumerlaeaceae bacterium]